MGEIQVKHHAKVLVCLFLEKHVINEEASSNKSCFTPDFKRDLEPEGMLLGLASSNLENSHFLLQQNNSMFQLDVLLHKLAVYVSLRGFLLSLCLLQI